MFHYASPPRQVVARYEGPICKRLVVDIPCVGARRTGWPTLPDDQTAVNPLYGIFGQLRPRFRTEIDTVGNAVAEPDYRIVSRVEFLQATYLLDASDPQEAIDVLVDRLDDLQ